MPVNKRDKTQLIMALGRTKSKAHRLVLALRFQGLEEDARRIERRAKTLSKKIDDLLAAAMDEWTGNANAITARLSKSNTRLQAAIREIEKKNDVAGNVIKAVSLIDLVIETAASLVS
jgi:hypothetical protein